jgi:hypothetical protein
MRIYFRISCIKPSYTASQLTFNQAAPSSHSQLSSPPHRHSSKLCTPRISHYHSTASNPSISVWSNKTCNKYASRSLETTSIKYRVPHQIGSYKSCTSPTVVWMPTYKIIVLHCHQVGYSWRFLWFSFAHFPIACCSEGWTPLFYRIILFVITSLQIDINLIYVTLKFSLDCK